MVRSSLAAAVCLSIIVLAADAAAQINPFGRGRPGGFSSADFSAINEAAQRLLNRPSLEIGQAELWENPRTRASGAVSVEERLQRRGTSCYRLNYGFVPATGPARDTPVTWCRTGQGWKIA